MGLLEQRAKAQKKSSGLSALAAKAKQNGKSGSTPKLSPLAAKAAGKQKLTGLAAARARRERPVPKPKSKLDFYQGGILYHNCQQASFVPGHEHWTVDVSNGTDTITFHNRHSAWFTDVEGGMKEPARQVMFGIHERFVREMRARGLPASSTERVALREKKEAEERAAKRKKTKKKKPMTLAEKLKAKAAQ